MLTVRKCIFMQMHCIAINARECVELREQNSLEKRPRRLHQQQDAAIQKLRKKVRRFSIYRHYEALTDWSPLPRAVLEVHVAWGQAFARRPKPRDIAFSNRRPLDR